MEEMIGHTLLEFMPPGSESVIDPYRHVVETGEPLARESGTYEGAYGRQQLSLVFDIHAVKFGDGFVSTWSDVTERKKIESDLRESEERFRTSVEALQEAFGIYSAIRD